MDDALAMRLVERVGDLAGNPQHIVGRQRSFLQPRGERLALEQFHDEEIDLVATLARRSAFGAKAADVIQHADVGMVELRNRPGFALEPCLELRIARGVRGENLDSDHALEPRVTGAIDLAHASRPQRAKNFVRTQTRSSTQRHAGIMH